MCLALYLGSAIEARLRKGLELSVERVDESCLPVLQRFSLPQVRYIGAHTGCSCGFPHVLAAQPIKWYPGIFDETEDRSKDLGSVEALFDLMRECLSESPQLELYPVWDGDESSPPKGIIVLDFAALESTKFLFTEGFLYRVSMRDHAGPPMD